MDIRWMSNNIGYPLAIQSLLSILPIQGMCSPVPQRKHLPVNCIQFLSSQFLGDVQSSPLGLGVATCGLVSHKLPPSPLFT